MSKFSTLCSICSRNCDRAVPYSASCSGYKPFDVTSVDKPDIIEECANPEITLHPPVILSPKQYGQRIMGKHKKRRR